MNELKHRGHGEAGTTIIVTVDLACNTAGGWCGVVTVVHVTSARAWWAAWQSACVSEDVVPRTPKPKSNCSKSLFLYWLHCPVTRYWPWMTTWFVYFFQCFLCTLFVDDYVIVDQPVSVVNDLLRYVPTLCLLQCIEHRLHFMCINFYIVLIYKKIKAVDLYLLYLLKK